MTSFPEDSTSVLRFAKLNGSNYRAWAFNMRLYLESINLFKFVDGTAGPPEEDEDGTYSTEMTASVRRAKRAWTHICLAVEA